METYSLLRAFADSWVLLVMFGFFLGVIFWAFRPGSRETHDDAGQIPLRDDVARDAPQPASNPSKKGAANV